MDQRTSDEYEVFETDIAIVGMALRAPGSSDVARFWENLRDGVESIRACTDEELLAAGESPALIALENYVKATAPLDGMEDFDGRFFGLSPKESAIMDPQHRHFIECCWEALESAAHPPRRFGGPIGVFAGCGMGSYFAFHLCARPELVRDVGMFLLRHTGNDKDFLATRVSYLLGLQGPAVGVQTACSTSLVAVHLAAQSLLRRECDLALAGGVTIELPHRRGYLYRENEILSPDGHCRAFDHRARGTVFGSGAGVVALRRLTDALDDGDVVHAVIRGSAVNNDGSRKVSYLAPSVDGQAACMVEAYAVAGVDPRSVEYVECHGTGTYLGDPIELEALTRAFRARTADRGFCRIGSVKSNIGHLDTAAGVASLIKATLALEHGAIPPSLGFERANPTVDLDASPFRVADRLTPWPAPASHPRRAAVNSLGVGGTNAHVVLQEPPVRERGSDPTRTYQLLTLSARSTSSLDASSRRLAAHLRAHPELELADVAYTLQHGRDEFDERRVLAASSVLEAAELLESGDPRRVATDRATESTSVVFLLPGGGAQYVGMGAGLAQSEPVFREHLERGLALARAEHGLELRPLLFASDSEREGARAELEAMRNQLPAIFLVSYAMAKLLEHYGVRPAALLGHSLGENTAACLAGVLSFEDALGLVALRGRLFEKAPRGAMLSVALAEEALRPWLDERLDLAVVNAADLCVVSGAPDDIDALARRIGELEAVEARRVAVPTAAHSRLLEPVLEPFRAYLRAVSLQTPRVPIVSNRTGAWLTNAEATSPDYWVEHLRHTVRFADGLATLLDAPRPRASDDGPRTPTSPRRADEATRSPSGSRASAPSRALVECGPGRLLVSLARQHPSFAGQAPPQPHHHAFTSMRHADDPIDDAAHFTTCLGRVWASGAALDRDALWPGEQRLRVTLPTYAWDHAPYFISAPDAQARGTVASGTAASGTVASGTVASGTVASGTRTSGASAAPSKIVDVENWGWEPRWRETPAPRADAEGEHTWLLFMDRVGVGARLRERLVERGHRVIAVHEGDAFQRLDAREYALGPERGKEGYSALLADVAACGHTPDRVVHLWMLEREPAVRPGSSLYHHHQERGFFSLLFLAQALLDESWRTPLHVTLVTNGMQRVEDEALPYPGKATALGPLRVMARELDGVSSTSIDVTLPEAPRGALTLARGLFRRGEGPSARPELEPLVSALLAELHAPSLDTVLAQRGSRRLEQRFESVPLARIGGLPVSLRQGGTYLITGGLGGIGLTVAEELARRCGAKLVLVSRTSASLPPRHRWDAWLAEHAPEERTSRRLARLRRIEAAGGEVMLAAADVTSVHEVKAAVAAAQERFGEVHGVMHAAGVLEDGLIATKTEASVDRVLTPKVQGALVLEEVFERQSLDFLALFSSTSAITAPAGQADYVAANAFLDALAESRSARGQRTLSLAWGVWNRVGMAYDAAHEGDARSSLGGSGASGDVGIESSDPPPAPTHPWLHAIGRGTARGEASGQGASPSRERALGREQGLHPETVLIGEWSPENTWILGEHRTQSGHAVMVGTAYLELARAALAARGHAGPFVLEDLFFLRPLSVADGTSRRARVTLRPEAGGYRLEVRGEVELDGRRGWELNAQARVTPAPLRTAEPLDLRVIEARCDDAVTPDAPSFAEDARGITTPQERFLRFGPRWRVLRRAALGRGEALGRLALPDAFARDTSELGLHPALLDIATGWAMELIPGYRGDALWVPVSYERVHVYDRVPSRVASWIRVRPGSDDEAQVARFDVVVTDERGERLVEVEGLTLRKLAVGVELASRGRPAPSEVELEPPVDAGRAGDTPSSLGTSAGGESARAARPELPGSDDGSSALRDPGRDALARRLELGILPAEGADALMRVLAGPPRARVVVSSVELDALIREAARPAPSEAGSLAIALDRPALRTELVEPRDELEKALVRFWQELLGVRQVGVKDDFFDLGGHSLIAVRLFAQIKRTFRVDLPISALFEAPTIERCAALIRGRLEEDDGTDRRGAPGDATRSGGSVRASAGQDRDGARRRRRQGAGHLHLVAMHTGDGGPQTPFFLVAGMFGNVLNLRHLAGLIGADRRCYGLQARGLYGGAPPHETFEEMAAAYLSELRTVQPHGPYLLGGFSGGGITAYEMAQQLARSGEEVALLVMLDTPLPFPPPELSARERAAIHLQDLRSKGLAHVRDWAARRWRWETDKLRAKLAPRDDAPPPGAFQDRAIEGAFRRALGRYALRRWPGHLTLMRPPLEVAYDLGDGRLLDEQREYVYPDNGWTPFVGSIEVIEVPGDHDSMVLEPNVRTLARRLRERLDAAERGPHRAKPPQGGAERIIRASEASADATDSLAGAAE